MNKRFPRRAGKIVKAAKHSAKHTFETASKTIRGELRAPALELASKFEQGARRVHHELPETVAALMAYHAHKHASKGIHGLMSWMNKRHIEQIANMDALPNTAARRQRKWFPIKWEPISLLRRGIEENEKLGVVGMEHFCSQAIQRNAVDTASLLPEKITLDEGMPNKYMKSAKELYGTTHVPIYTTGKNGEADLAYSTGGYNAQLVYAPFGYKQQAAATTAEPFANSDAQAQFETCGIFNEAMIYNFIIDCGMQQWLSTMVPTTDPFKSIASTSDVFLPIESVSTKKCVRNYNKYNDVDVTCYVLECVRASNTWPVEDWFDWTDYKKSDPNHAPAGNEDYNPTDTNRENAYFHGARFKQIKEMVWAPGSGGGDSTTPGTGRTFCVETSCVPGMTPQMSPHFNMNWKVVEVLKKRLRPDDIWELTFERKFKKSTSWRNLASKFGGGAKVPLFSNAIVGDYQLLFVARGIPGTYLVPDGNSSVDDILHPEQVVAGKVDSSTPSVVVPADCMQSAIEMTTTHTLNHHLPLNEFWVKSNPTVMEAVPAFIAQKYVKRLTGYRYTPFGISGFAPIQTTQQQQQTGGLK